MNYTIDVDIRIYQNTLIEKEVNCSMKKYIIIGLFIVLAALALFLGLSCGGGGGSAGVPTGVTVTIPPGL